MWVISHAKDRLLAGGDGEGGEDGTGERTLQACAGGAGRTGEPQLCRGHFLAARHWPGYPRPGPAMLGLFPLPAQQKDKPDCSFMPLAGLRSSKTHPGPGLLVWVMCASCSSSLIPACTEVSWGWLDEGPRAAARTVITALVCLQVWRSRQHACHPYMRLSAAFDSPGCCSGTSGEGGGEEQCTLGCWRT